MKSRKRIETKTLRKKKQKKKENILKKRESLPLQSKRATTSDFPATAETWRHVLLWGGTWLSIVILGWESKNKTISRCPRKKGQQRQKRNGKTNQEIEIERVETKKKWTFGTCTI